jgi:hypothetical protein
VRSTLSLPIHCSAIAALIMLLIARRAKRRYNDELRVGAWHEGIIVFPTGDLVVRFRGLFGSIDRTIEAVYLSRADVDRGWSFKSCGKRAFLRIYYLGIDARPQVVSVCEKDLRDPVARVAEFINEVKSKTMTTSF